MSLRDLLRDLLGRGKCPGPQAAAVRKAATERTSSQVTPTPSRKQRSWEAFDRRLRALTREPRGAKPIVAGRLQVIALSRIKERLGDRWPRVADVAHVWAQRVLERRLADADVYLQFGDDGYLILFAELSAEEAAFKAQAITREITTHLMGHMPEGPDLSVQVVVREIVLPEPGGTVDLITLIAALDGRREEAERAPREPRNPAQRPAPAGEKAAVGGLGFTYRPVWSRRGGAVVLYSCVPVGREHAEDGLAMAGSEAGAGVIPADEFDGAALQSVLAALDGIRRDGRATLVLTPVHWSTLAQLRTRREYLERCQQAPPGVRQQLGFSVLDIPPGAWRTPLSEHLAPLHGYGRLLCARVTPHPSQVWKFAGTAIQLLTFDADRLDLADTVRYRLIECFVRRAHAQQLAAGAFRVGDRARARALLAAGADFLAGDAIAPALPEPGEACKLTLAV